MLDDDKAIEYDGCDHGKREERVDEHIDSYPRDYRVICQLKNGTIIIFLN